MTEDYRQDRLDIINFDNHTWEFGHFGEDNNGFSAYGFRQDGTIIRVTSKYEAEVIAFLFKQALAEAKGGN